MTCSYIETTIAKINHLEQDQVQVLAVKCSPVSLFGPFVQETTQIWYLREQSLGF